MQNIRAVSPQLFDIAIPGFLEIGAYDGEAPILEEMYTVRGSHSLIIGSGYTEEFSFALVCTIVCSSPLRVPNSYSENHYKQVYKLPLVLNIRLSCVVGSSCSI
jgi:hypothetical protein